MSDLRIPIYTNNSFEYMKLWFSLMFESNLLFHPDDAPESIISINTGERLFSDEECVRIKEILSTMFNNFGDQVYEAAYPCFMKAMGIQIWCKSLK